MKSCAKCGETKPLSAFYATERGIGLPLEIASYCKVCTLETARVWRANNPGYSARPRRGWRGRNPDRVVLIDRAKDAVKRAIRRGKLQRPDRCAACGTVGPVDAAHHDYTRPLDVRWLCRRCHHAWDRAEPHSLPE